MSRYATWTQVAERYPDFAKVTGANTVSDVHIRFAEDEVDARLAPKYSVPFTPVPGVVTDLSIDLAYFKAAFASEKGQQLGKILDARFKAILDGSLLLTTSAGLISGRERAWSTHEDYHTSFGVDPPENWDVSSQWQTDQQEDRGQI